MRSDLAPDRTPIVAGPIYIAYSFQANEVDECLDYWVFDDIANDVSPRLSLGRWALETTVEVMIDELDLPILSPQKWERLPDGSTWGPHHHHDYAIEPQAYVDLYSAICKRAKMATVPALLTVISMVKETAEEYAKLITSRTNPSTLPGAFHSTGRMSGLLEDGHIVSFRDFKDTQHVLRTSPGKYCDVFSQIILEIGDKGAKDKLKELDIYDNPRTRELIRWSLYISTQGLVDLLERIESHPEDYPQFNEKSIDIIRSVISEDMLFQGDIIEEA